MKKNFAMRIAACLLVVTMLSLCMVSYTYAKYTTNAKDSDNAKVAIWGVTVTAEVSNLFKEAYTNVVEETNKTTVQSSVASTDVIAPGTEGSLTAITITGKPEVATEVIATANLELENWVVGNEFYCPLVFKVGEVVIDSSNKTVEDFEIAVETTIISAIEGDNPVHETNANLAHTVVVSWYWAFESGNDAKDTALGNAAEKATVSLDVSVTVEQVQK